MCINMTPLLIPLENLTLIKNKTIIISLTSSDTQVYNTIDSPMVYRVKYTAIKVIKRSIKLPHIRGTTILSTTRNYEFWCLNVGAFLQREWQGEAGEEEKNAPVCVKPPLVLITASCLCR